MAPRKAAFNSYSQPVNPMRELLSKIRGALANGDTNNLPTLLSEFEQDFGDNWELANWTDLPYISAAAGQVDTLNILLDHKRGYGKKPIFDVNAKDVDNEETLAMVAAAHGHVAILECLRTEWGADLSLTNRSSWSVPVSALSVAGEKDKMEVIKYLAPLTHIEDILEILKSYPKCNTPAVKYLFEHYERRLAGLEQERLTLQQKFQIPLAPPTDVADEKAIATAVNATARVNLADMGAAASTATFFPPVPTAATSNTATGKPAEAPKSALLK
jgi:hypothetical protein